MSRTHRSGSRSRLASLQNEQLSTRLPGSSAPPLLCGFRWSSVAVASHSPMPQYAHHGFRASSCERLPLVAVFPEREPHGGRPAAGAIVCRLRGPRGEPAAMFPGRPQHVDGLLDRNQFRGRQSPRRNRVQLGQLGREGREPPPASTPPHPRDVPLAQIVSCPSLEIPYPVRCAWVGGRRLRVTALASVPGLFLISDLPPPSAVGARLSLSSSWAQTGSAEDKREPRSSAAAESG